MKSQAALSSIILVFFAVFSVVIIAYMGGLPALPRSGADVSVDADLQIMDVAGIFGGHITWEIHGTAARELRGMIGAKFGVTHIDISVASRYFKGDLERVVEENRFGCGYLGFVRIQHSDPLHGDTDGIINDVSDIQGLIGSVDSNSTIVLKMLIRGTPVSGLHPSVSRALALAPFYALMDSAEHSEVDIGNITVETHQRSIIAGTGNFVVPEGTLRLRFVLGEFVMSDDTEMGYDSFSVISSPLVLFAVFIGVAYAVGRINYMLVGDKTDTLMGKHARLYVRGVRISMFILYLVLPLSGLWLLLLFIAVLGASYPVLRKIYRL